MKKLQFSTSEVFFPASFMRKNLFCLFCLRLCGAAYVLTRGFIWTERLCEFSLYLEFSSLSSTMCFLLTFASTTSFFFFFFFVLQPVGEPQRTLLCLPQLRSEVGLNVWPFMFVHMHYTQTDKRTERKKTRAEKMFPVNEAGCATKKHQWPSCRSAATMRGKWIMHHFRTSEKIILQFRVCDLLQPSDFWHRLLKHQG